MRKPHMTVINQQDLAEQIADSFCDNRYTVEEVRTIIKDLEFFVTDALLHATEKKPVRVRLFSGLHIDSRYIPPHKKISFRGIATEIPEKYKAKAVITRYFNDKSNDLKESWTG